jgi:hypothetical protein
MASVPVLINRTGLGLLFGAFRVGPRKGVALGIRRLPDDVVGDLPAKVGGVVPLPTKIRMLVSIRMPCSRRRISAR